MEKKQFRKKDSPNSQPVIILNENDNFISLSNGDNVLADRFNFLYEEIMTDVVDPKSFLKSGSYGKLAGEFEENLKKVDTSKITDQPSISVVDKTTGDKMNIGTIQEPVVTKIDNTKNTVNAEEDLYRDEVAMFGLTEANNRRRIRMKRQPLPTNSAIPNESIQTQQPTYQQPINPSEMIFKSFKRNHDITINIEFKDKIGSPDFVKMMLENIEGDIIGYYKNLIMDNIMSKVSDVESEVEYQIIKEIYGEDEANKFKTDKVTIKAVETKKGIHKAGKQTKSGKQKFFYFDENGKEVELLPESAEKKKLKPVIV
jgi:hypothetical protein